jgi:hypothetical protein
MPRVRSLGQHAAGVTERRARGDHRQVGDEHVGQAHAQHVGVELRGERAAGTQSAGEPHRDTRDHDLFRGHADSAPVPVS